VEDAGAVAFSFPAALWAAGSVVEVLEAGEDLVEEVFLAAAAALAAAAPVAAGKLDFIVLKPLTFDNCFSKIDSGFIKHFFDYNTD